MVFAHTLSVEKHLFAGREVGRRAVLDRAGQIYAGHHGEGADDGRAVVNRQGILVVE